MLSGQLQAQPAIDKSERDQSTPEPHVDMPDDSPSLVLTECKMLQHAACSHEPDGSEEYEADDRVC